MAKSKSKAKIKDAITKKQQAELVKLARAANRRLERAAEKAPGQRRSLENIIQNYHLIDGSRGKVFSQAKAKTKREYTQRMSELQKFMKAKTSKRKSWESLKTTNMSAAQKKLREMGHEVTDEELEIVLEEIGGSSPAFYKALENVQAAKGPEKDELSKKQILDAIYTRRTDLEATLAAIDARKK